MAFTLTDYFVSDFTGNGPRSGLVRVRPTQVPLRLIIGGVARTLDSGSAITESIDPRTGRYSVSVPTPDQYTPTTSGWIVEYPDGTALSGPSTTNMTGLTFTVDGLKTLGWGLAAGGSTGQITVVQGPAFNARGSYAGNTVYLPYDVVSYNGLLYQCILITTGSQAPTNATYWKLLLDVSSEFVAQAVVPGYLNGSESVHTVFNGDGSITASYAQSGLTVHTVFNGDGSITETYSGPIAHTKTTVFNGDGSITETIT